ncbi:MAG: AMP-binding protein [Acidimicrobiales bacterium]
MAQAASPAWAGDWPAAARLGMTLAYWADRIGETPAIITPRRTASFAELNGRANRLARALRRRGLAAGDHVAVLCGNQLEFADAAFASLRAGLRMTPINRHLIAEEVAYILGDCDARALVVDAAYLEIAVAALAGAPLCASVLVAGAGPPDLGGAELEVPFEDYEAALGAEAAVDLEDPSLGTPMFYTSGTTGRPKGVWRSPGGSAAMLGANIYGYREGEGDVHLCSGPLHHAAPLAFSLSAPITYGAGVVLMDRFDAAEALRLIAEHKVTHTHMVPTMFHRLLSLPEHVRLSHDHSSLRYVLHGAAPCPVPVKRRIIDWLGPVVWEYYAASEGVGSFVDTKTWLAHPGTVGKPYTVGQLMVGDEEANQLPAGEVGLIWLRAPSEARFAYYKDTGKTAESYRGDYFTLGDVGYEDVEGYFYLTDRSANLVISGGVNIYPAEVDAVLLEHPAVADAATIGVPDAEWGESVLAVVELRAGSLPSEELASELRDFCLARLAHYKCPRSVDFVPELPRQDNGKIYKRLLRERYRQAAAG